MTTTGGTGDGVDDGKGKIITLSQTFGHLRFFFCFLLVAAHFL